MSDSEDANQIEEEVEPYAHKNLLQAISRLGKTQHIRKPTRSETSFACDEFHLVKSQLANVRGSSVLMSDIVKVLKKTSNHIELGRQLKNTQNQKKVLQKPLERPVADKIQRTIGYDKAKKSLSRWDAVVERNRAAEHQVFPLDYAEIHVETVAPTRPRGTTIKSDLMLEMENVDAKLRALKGSMPANEKDDVQKLNEKLTRDELISRRKELAYLRVRESHKSAKARLQNKIKSKKYHKFLKREKLKEQIKEFELLQKSNPEAALDRLESIEKNRVMERASLRHKNTGTWAKNLQVRAKYDKDVRKDLAEQLALSRELTQKQRDDEDSNSDGEKDDDKEPDEIYDPFNPWVKGRNIVEQSDEVKKFTSGYRKYWMDRNKNVKAMNEYKGKEDVKSAETFVSVVNDAEHLESDILPFRSMNEHKGKKDVKYEETFISATDGTEHPKSDISQLESVNKKMKTRLARKSLNESGWIIEDVLNEPSAGNIDDIFDNAEEMIQKKVESKLFELSKVFQKKHKKIRMKSTKKQGKLDSRDLSFKTEAKRPDMDEELLETPANVATAALKQNPHRLKSTKGDATSSESKIDPTKFATVTPKFLQSALPDMVNSEEFLDDQIGNHQSQTTIAEAFEDDDIVADFERDREDERKKSANDDIDLTLPGWGSWAGCGISKERQTKRLILKFAKDAPRRDDNKGNVYINEERNQKLKQHLVSDLPFPFKTVKDYEASIRAPIGRTFVPETAFRMLTRPEVVTKMGAIIDPMNEDVLIQVLKRPRNVVDKRIAIINKNKVR